MVSSRSAKSSSSLPRSTGRTPRSDCFERSTTSWIVNWVVPALVDQRRTPRPGAPERRCSAGCAPRSGSSRPRAAPTGSVPLQSRLCQAHPFSARGICILSELRIELPESAAADVGAGGRRRQVRIGLMIGPERGRVSPQGGAARRRRQAAEEAASRRSGYPRSRGLRRVHRDHAHRTGDRADRARDRRRADPDPSPDRHGPGGAVEPGGVRGPLHARASARRTTGSSRTCSVSRTSGRPTRCATIWRS
jgi:hypothetical protein